MLKLTFFTPLYNFGESLIDNVFRDKVEPKIGSVVYCDLAMGYAEHSGIYIGNNQIVQLSSNGLINIATPKDFIDGTTAMSIYVSCRDEEAVGCPKVANRAKSMVSKTRDYNVLMDNCHQFSAGCLIDNFENSSNFLWMLKDDAKRVLGSNSWRVWDIDIL